MGTPSGRVMSRLQSRSTAVRELLQDYASERGGSRIATAAPEWRVAYVPMAPQGGHAMSCGKPHEVPCERGGWALRLLPTCNTKMRMSATVTSAMHPGSSPLPA